MPEKCELLEKSDLSLPTNLPPEILEHILSYLPPSSQQTFHAAAFVSRAWYSAAIKYLYHSPILTGKNFDSFIRSVCPSINAHVRYNGLADLIRRLDMSGLVHNGSRSLTARLIGRVKHNLDELIAPQASFGVNSLAAISKCRHLRCLDLGFVSEAILMPDLLRSIQGLDELVLLYLPRASSYMVSRKPITNLSAAWPPRLRELHLNGGFAHPNMRFLKSLPPSVSELWLERIPRCLLHHIKTLFDGIGPQLETLHVTLPAKTPGNLSVMSAISQGCHNVRNLCVNIELIGDCWGTCLHSASFYPLPSVERLEIGCLEEHDDACLDWCLINMCSYLFSEKVPKLRRLLIHRKLRWMDSETRSQQVTEMNDLLKALAREDGENARIPEDQAGVIFFGAR